MIELIWAHEVAARAPERWAKQYEGSAWPDKQIITEKLAALPPEQRTHEVISAIIGNDSWTKIICDECGQHSPVLATLGYSHEWDCPSVSICEGCLSKAVNLIIKAKP